MAAISFNCGTEEQHPSYTNIVSKTMLTSSSLSTVALAKRTANARANVDSLSNGFETYYYITPTNMSGKILQAYLMVGKLGGNGPGGSALMLLAHGQGYEEATVPSINLLWDFDFKTR
jgi:hypothetical protein